MKPIPFSGWEPHNTVAWVERLRAGLAADPLCHVLGREPVTSSELWIVGTVIEERHNMYDRGYTVATAEGATFRIGGTNTTSSIATQIAVLFAPDELVPPPPAEADEVLAEAAALVHSAAVAEPGVIATEVERLEYWIRVMRLVPLLVEKYIGGAHSRRPELADLLESSTNYVPFASPGPEFWSSVSHVLTSAEVPNSRARAEVARLLGLLPDRGSATALARLLSAPPGEVRRFAALSLRSLEDLLQRLRSLEPAIVRDCIDGAVASLSDPADDPATRVYIAEALGYFGNDDRRSFRVLTDRLAQDEVEHVRWACAVALGRRAQSEGVAIHLIDALKHEASPRVQRATLLSLGRVLSRMRLDPEEIAFDELDVHDLEATLRNFLQSDNPDVAANAAFAIGELPHPSAEARGELVDRLARETPYVVRCHCLLALAKSVAAEGLTVELRDRLESALRENLFVPSEIQHPASSYHEWFLLNALQVLTLLDSPLLAGHYARRASNAFSASPKRSLYFDGLSHYHLAEHELASPTVTARAVERLRRAAVSFSEVATTTPGLGDLGEHAQASAVTRSILASARAEFIETLLSMRSCSLTAIGGDHEKRLRKVADLYQQVLECRPQELISGSTLGPMTCVGDAIEFGKVLLLKDLAGIAAQLEQLRLHLVDGGEEPARSTFGRCDALIRRLEIDVASAPSQQLVACAGALRTLVDDAYRQLKGERSPHSVFGEFVFSAMSALLTPLPVPNVDHRLLGVGRAAMDVLPASRIQGCGAEGDPFIAPAGVPFRLRVIVNVLLKSEDEVLVLREERDGAVVRDVPVHVHESSTSLELDYPTADASSILSTTLRLLFAFRGAVEVVQERRIYVRFSAEAAADVAQARSTSDAIIELHGRKQELERELASLEEATAGGRGFTRQIADKRQELRHLEEDIAELASRLKG